MEVVYGKSTTKRIHLLFTVTHCMLYFSTSSLAMEMHKYSIRMKCKYLYVQAVQPVFRRLVQIKTRIVSQLDGNMAFIFISFFCKFCLFTRSVCCVWFNIKCLRCINSSPFNSMLVFISIHSLKLCVAMK